MIRLTLVLFLSFILAGCALPAVPAQRSIVVSQSLKITQFDSRYATLGRFITGLSLTSQWTDQNRSFVLAGSNAAHTYYIRSQSELAAGNVELFEQYIDLALKEVDDLTEWVLKQFKILEKKEDFS